MPETLNPLAVTIGAAVVIFAFYSGAHALLHKRDSKSALLWMVACFTWPPLGPIAYWLFGRNRILTKARKLRDRFPREAIGIRETYVVPDLASELPENFPELFHISENVTGRPLLSGNHVDLLSGGEEAYPRMLKAIRDAKQSVRMISYIFDNDAIGNEFAEALGDAVKRGVDVKVLIDGIGEHYSLPLMSTVLRNRGVNAHRFLPPSLIPPSLHINLRNHRKILVVDGLQGFTGGMNISDRHFVSPARRKRPVVDLHFAIQGPIVAQMEGVFLEDWSFVTGEDCPATDPGSVAETGSTICRAISDGPNEDIDKLMWIILSAVSAARRSVRIMTPYFIPGQELSSALSAAALRGVEVEIVLPSKLDIPPVGWAARTYCLGLLPFGVRIYKSPGPFVHTKLLIIDDHYILIGSANLDPRSLRLNFEFNLEVYGEECAEPLTKHFVAARDQATLLSEQELKNRSLLVKLRDATAFLFSPLL